MGTREQKRIVLGAEAPISTVRRDKSRPTPFVFQWRAFQHELSFKTARLDGFSTGTSLVLANLRRAALKIGAAAPTFRKSRLSNWIAS
jgi:hypothetical protein